MPSPFPGMDLYIEDPEIWSDFHGDLAAQIRAVLNQQIQPRYVARLTPRVAYEVVEVTRATARGVRPDVGIWRSQIAEKTLSTPAPVVTPAPVQSRVPLELPTRLYTVEIYTTDPLELVTAIEILAPVNKRRGHDAHRDYLRKRQELFRSSVHLVEIDLLRGGERSPLQESVPPAPYYVMLSRADYRPTVDVWPIQLQDRLPVLPIPLLEPDPDASFDLGAAVAEVYERGGYANLIDYTDQPPPPPLDEKSAHWLEDHLRSYRQN
ncbi:MAG: DUF4058 family protein [Caldilineaceae bacterium]|nr:DUF4058 family protein [Caldilineaceae bacterium]